MCLGWGGVGGSGQQGWLSPCSPAPWRAPPHQRLCSPSPCAPHTLHPTPPTLCSFSLFLHHLPDLHTPQPPEVILRAMEATVASIAELQVVGWVDGLVVKGGAPRRGRAVCQGGAPTPKPPHPLPTHPYQESLGIADTSLLNYVVSGRERGVGGWGWGRWRVWCG